MDMRPYWVIGKTELKHMGEVLEPGYSVPPRVRFRQSIVPALCIGAQAAVQELSTGQGLIMEHY